MKSLWLAVAGLLASPVPAVACGGFFCSSAPVDQSAERILFVQDDPQTVTAYVEIKFQGDPDDFAWIVPVPSKPEYDTWYGNALQALDTATQPVFNTPFACFAPEAGAGGAVDDADNGGRGAVDVLGREQVGDYDVATVQSDDPRALIEWLRTNGYRITPEMEPFVGLYTAAGLKFAAVKLVAGKGLDSIKPLKMTYASSGPMVPLRLTAIAAQLEMGVKVFILGDGRFGPGEGVADVQISDDDLVFDPFSYQTNYTALVARAVDAAGGHGFVTEYAQPTAPLVQQIQQGGLPYMPDEETQKGYQALLDVLGSKPYITRLYTRLSPEEMDFDPTFVRAAGGDVSNVHDVPAPPGFENGGCGIPASDAVDPCAFAACGQGGRCFVAENDATGALEAGCACVDEALARPQPTVNQPGAPGNVTVSCGDARMNFMSPDLKPDVSRPDPILNLDPCQADPCGDHGECVSLNGSQSCRCEQGFIAVGRVDQGGKPFATCVPPRDQVPAEFYGRSLPEPGLPFPGHPTHSRGVPGTDSGCNATGSGAPAGALFLFALLAPFARRRRS